MFTALDEILGIFYILLIAKLKKNAIGEALIY
jgi:hypothetical protein